MWKRLQRNYYVEKFLDIKLVPFSLHELCQTCRKLASVYQVKLLGLSVELFWESSPKNN